MGGFGLTNPLLDAIKAARPDLTNPAPQTPPILNPGTASPQFSAIRAQMVKQPEQSAPPLIPPMNAPSVAPIGSSPQPSVKAPRGTIHGDEAERGRLMTTGSGISQIKNPFLHGVAKTADVIGGLLSPRLMQAIPGTEEHHNLLLGNANKALTQDEANAEKEAQAQNIQSEIAARPSEVALRGEQTHEAKARAEALENPQEKPGKLENPQQGYAAAITDAIQRGVDPAQDPHVQAWKTAIEGLKPQIPKAERPDTPEQQFIDEYQKVHQGSSVADAIHAYSAATQKPERGPTIIQQNNELDKISTRLGKPYETAGTQAQSKLDKIDQTMRSVDAGYVGQGLAIPELLTSLVSGQGTGVRITQPELNAITAHRGIKGNAESFFNSLAGKGSLTKEDKAQIKAVLNDAKTRVMEKVQLMNDAKDAIDNMPSREAGLAADKKYRAIQLNMEKYLEVRRDDTGNWYGSNDGGKTTFDLATGKEAK